MNLDRLRASSLPLQTKPAPPTIQSPVSVSPRPSVACIRRARARRPALSHRRSRNPRQQALGDQLRLHRRPQSPGRRLPGARLRHQLRPRRPHPAQVRNPHRHRGDPRSVLAQANPRPPVTGAGHRRPRRKSPRHQVALLRTPSQRPVAKESLRHRPARPLRPPRTSRNPPTPKTSPPTPPSPPPTSASPPTRNSISTTPPAPSPAASSPPALTSFSPSKSTAASAPSVSNGDVGYNFGNHALPQSWNRGLLVGHEFSDRTEAYVEIYDIQDANRIPPARVSANSPPAQPKQRETTLGLGGRQALNHVQDPQPVAHGRPQLPDRHRHATASQAGSPTSACKSY